MNETKTSSGHHVAWADRIGLNKIWFQNIQACDATFGTEIYSNSVWRLYYSIVNIKDGPDLKTQIDSYINDTWDVKVEKKVDQWKRSNPYEANDFNIVEFEREKIREDLLPELCYYMRQLLEDNGFGFYKSSIEEDEMI